MAKAPLTNQPNQAPRDPRPARPAQGCSTTTIGSTTTAKLLKTIEKTSTTTKLLKTLTFSTTTTLCS